MINWIKTILWSPAPYDNNADNSIEKTLTNWQTASLNNMLVIALIVFLPALVFVDITEIKRGEYIPAALFTGIYFSLVTLAFARKLPTRFRGWAVVIILYLTAVIATLRGGLAGDGRVYFAILPIFTIPLLGVTAGFRVALLGIGTYFSFALLAEKGILSKTLISEINPVSFIEWSYAGLVMIALSSVTFALTWFLHNFLLKSLASEREARLELAQTNLQLSNKNISLEESNLQRKLLTRQLISVQEKDRSKLARDLHDEIMSDLAVISFDIGKANSPETIQTQIQILNNRLRKTINRLRSPMLDFGLYTGLDDLVDRLSGRVPSEVTIQLKIPQSDFRLPTETEEHLYRIVQQACENALIHSNAKTITISGVISDIETKLEINDDGIGFDLSAGLDLSHYLKEGHFGLSNMVERAKIIGAELNFSSEADEGTSIMIRWVNEVMISDKSPA